MDLLSPSSPSLKIKIEEVLGIKREKRAFVFPAAALDLLITKRSTIWLPKKKKGGPPRRVQNLDPPTRTSFPHTEPRRRGAGWEGAGREGSDSPGAAPPGN